MKNLEKIGEKVKEGLSTVVAVAAVADLTEVLGREKCIKLLVLTAGMSVKYHSGQEKANPYIVKIVIEKGKDNKPFFYFFYYDYWQAKQL